MDSKCNGIELNGRAWNQTDFMYDIAGEQKKEIACLNSKSTLCYSHIKGMTIMMTICGAVCLSISVSNAILFKDFFILLS